MLVWFGGKEFPLQKTKSGIRRWREVGTGDLFSRPSFLQEFPRYSLLDNYFRKYERRNMFFWFEIK